MPDTYMYDRCLIEIHHLELTHNTHQALFDAEGNVKSLPSNTFGIMKPE